MFCHSWLRIVTNPGVRLIRSGCLECILVKGNIEKPEIPRRNHKMYLNISVTIQGGLPVSDVVHASYNTHKTVAYLTHQGITILGPLWLHHLWVPWFKILVPISAATLEQCIWRSCCGLFGDLSLPDVVHVTDIIILAPLHHWWGTWLKLFFYSKSRILGVVGDDAVVYIVIHPCQTLPMLHITLIKWLYSISIPASLSLHHHITGEEHDSISLFQYPGWHLRMSGV